MRFVFMGTPEFAKLIVESLLNHDGFKCVGIYSQPDRPVGRKQLLTAPPVAEFAAKRGIALFQPEKLTDDDARMLADLAPDVIIVAAYGQILPASVLSAAVCINLHTSLLPAYRGASPLQETLLSGDRYAGVTAIVMNEGLDTGDIVGYTYVEVPDGARYECFLKHLGIVAAGLTKEVLTRWGTLRPLRQWDVDASKVKKHRKEEGLVDFDDATALIRKYAAFYPWPGIYLASGLKLKEAERIEADSVNIPGTILALEEEGALIGCGRGSLRISRVQPPSKTEMDAASYLRGKRSGVGDLFL